MDEIEPKPEHFDDPYVLQLIETISIQDDEIQEMRQAISTLVHNATNNGYLPKDWTLKVLAKWTVGENGK